MRRILVCLSALFVSACNHDAMIDNIRGIENNESTTGPALVLQKQVFDGGCLTYVFEGKPLRDLIAAMPDAKSIPAKDAHTSPPPLEAWRVGRANPFLVEQLSGGVSCSASVNLGDPQRLHDAAVTLIQSRAAFTRGTVDRSARSDAEREAWCTSGLYPYVVVLYRRTTGSRAAFLANVFKAQGATFSACRPNS
jgi:hypothetical protein